MKKRLYIFRHGETDYNREMRLQGRSIDSTLNKYGIQQVNRFFEEYRDIPFELIYSSDLMRSIQSVEAFGELKIPHIIDSRITEVSWGENEGKVLSPWVIHRFRRMVKEWQSGNHDYRIPGGESATELKNRIDSFINDLNQREEQTILISSHGRAIRMLIARLMGESVSAMEKYGHDNTGLYLLEGNSNGYELTKANDTSHLK